MHAEVVEDVGFLEGRLVGFRAIPQVDLAGRNLPGSNRSVLSHGESMHWNPLTRH